MEGNIKERERLLSDGTLENWAERKKEVEDGIIDIKRRIIYFYNKRNKTMRSPQRKGMKSDIEKEIKGLKMEFRTF